MGPYYGVHICQPVAATATAVSRETDSVYDIIRKSSPSLPLPTPTTASLYEDRDLGCKYHHMSSLQILTGPEYIAAAEAAESQTPSHSKLTDALRLCSGCPATALPHPGPLHSACPPDPNHAPLAALRENLLMIQVGWGMGHLPRTLVGRRDGSQPWMSPQLGSPDLTLHISHQVLLPVALQATGAKRKQSL